MEVVLIRGAAELRRKLSAMGLTALDALGGPLRAGAEALSAEALAGVPVDTGGLAASGFSDGPLVNRRTMSATATAGYEAPHAAYVHEGVHGSFHTWPPMWLEETAQGREGQLAQAVGDALWSAISKAAK